jgi:dihydroorotate dehydrogenase
MNIARRGFLAANQFAYEHVARPVIFRWSAQDAHQRMVGLLRRLDASPLLCGLLRAAHQAAFEGCETSIGGVKLSYPLMLSAGMVKGLGFQTDADALDAVVRGQNIIPGWRSVPSLVGLVEFGSFTRHPRMGNAGTVIWRDVPTQSTQNRVGLKNPGAAAAAAFLAKHRTALPPQFGINIAVSPGVVDVDQEQKDVLEAVSTFLDQGIQPTWFTLNVSCPNTEDDPGGRQTEAQTRQLCSALVGYLLDRKFTIPVWVKISPGLAVEQYRILMRVFHEVGAQAVIATNTLGQSVPDDSTMMAGVGGGKLHNYALEAVQILMEARTRYHYAVDVIGCGGILDGRTYQDFRACGVGAVQYWSALVYRGPLAAAVIQNESKNG